MKIEEIETFMCVLETCNISAAAERLFVTQGAVSHRIHSLESKLNTQLFVRNKGQRNLYLTPAGENFIPIAHQWLSLWYDTKSLSTLPQKQEITIASVDLVNSYTLVPLYQRILQSSGEISLYIRTHHSEEIHSLLSNHLVDIGFVFSQIHYPNIISEPIYRELMYLVCNKKNDYYDQIHPSKLDPTNEVYLRWGNDFELWHDTYWPERKYCIRINTGSMISHYLNTPNRWSIVPMSVVSVLQQTQDIVYYNLSDSPPPRICYQLTHRFPKPSTELSIKHFTNMVYSFVHENTAVCSFEPWMLD